MSSNSSFPLSGVTMNRTFRLLGPAALALVAFACGNGPELIDRTQPNYIKKSDLLSGTWYFAETIVDVPSTSAVAAIGFGSNELEKVRFEVQEDTLVAFRTYEIIPGIDPQVDRQRSTIGKVVYIDGRPYRGSPVAAWPIQSHFDRQRQYNPATGEQTNVLEENGSDRPWYDREFIRVDWAHNQITNHFSATKGFFAPEGHKAFEVYVTPIDQNVGDGAFFTDYQDRGGKKELAYFDFTLRQYFNPPTMHDPDYGEFAYCWVDPRVDCAAAEVKIRSSFLKVDEAHVQDYEPLAYGERLQKKFGYFRTEGVSYDRNRGITESGRILFANRHNIWKWAHDTQGNVIPVQKREVEPVVYYLTPNFPKDLLPAARALEESWDSAFRQAVAVPRGIEIKDAPKMFYVCETPVPEGAPAECGPAGLSVRLGDLRFNTIPWIDQPQLTGPLGLGPSMADPETGEIIQGVANIYGAALDTWVADAQQVMDVLTGELTVNDIITGKNAKDYVFSHLNPTDPRRPITGPWTSGQGLESDPQRPLSTFARIQGNLKTQIQAAKHKGTLPPFRQDRRRVVESLIAQNPALESELINTPEVRAAVIAGSPGGDFRRRLESDPSLYRKVARNMMLGTGALERLEKQRVEAASRMHGNGCLYLAEFSDDAWLGLAKDLAKKAQAKIAELQAKGDPSCANQSACTQAEAKKLSKDWSFGQLRNAAFRAVAEHEVGHTVGLMHNFIGSFDAMNYMDGYWDLRKQTIGVMVGGQRVFPSSPQNLMDAAKHNQAQIEGGIFEYEYSSIMDYQSRMHGDIHGIGKYDKAAITFAYGGGSEPGYVEVFNQTRTDYGDPNVGVPTDNLAKSLIVRGAHTEIPLAQAEHYTPTSTFYTDRFHYTTLPFHFAEKGLPFEASLDQGIQRMASRSFRKWSDMELVYAKLEAEVRNWSLSQGGWSKPDWEKSRDILAKTGPVPVEVPFMFCSDYEVGANIACNRWDRGADVYEMARDWIERYQEYYPFLAFRRDRLGPNFGPDGYFNRVFGRYLGNLPNIYQQWLFNLYWYQSAYQLSSEQMEEYFAAGDPIYQNYWTMAVMDGTNLLLSNLSTPSTGYHGKLQNGNWVHLPENNPSNSRLVELDGTVGAHEAGFVAAMTATTRTPRYTDVAYVPRGPGRSMYTQFDTVGLDHYTRVDEIGHFWDQVASMAAVTTSETNFLGVDRGSDALRYSLPYYMTFNRELSSLFSGIWAEDRGRYASSLVKTQDGLAQVLPPVFVRGENYIANFNYPPPAPAPLDGNGVALPIAKVEASPTWSTRFYAELWGMAYFTENFNQEFASYNQVFRLGSGEAVTPTSGFSVVQFSDPFGGYVYAALQQDGIAESALPAAPKLITDGGKYVTKWSTAKTTNAPVDGLTAVQWEAKVRDTVRSLEMMRGLYGIFGQVW